LWQNYSIIILPQWACDGQVPGIGGIMRNVVCAILLLRLIVSTVMAQDTIAGRWKGEIGFSKMCLNLKSSMRTERGHWSMSFGQDIPLKEFQGLEQAMQNAAVAEFELPREAGTCTFEGQFQDGKGSGDFKFVPSPDFVNNMKALGYRKLASDQIFHLAISNVGTAFVKELQALGYNKLSIDQLLQMVIHGVTPAFVKEMAELGYKNLAFDQLVQLRIHGVDADYVRELNEALGKSPK
jgi:hypothetical protein